MYKKIVSYMARGGIASYLILAFILWFIFFRKKTISDATGGSSIDSGDTFGNTGTPRISKAKAYSIAMESYTIMNGMTWESTVGPALISLYTGLTEADFKLVFEQFGEHYAGFPGSVALGATNLIQWIQWELDETGQYYQKLKQMFPNIF